MRGIYFYPSVEDCDIYYGQPTEIRSEFVIDRVRDDLTNLYIIINGQRVDEMGKIVDTEKTYGFVFYCL